MQYSKAHNHRDALHIASDFGTDIANFVFEDRLSHAHHYEEDFTA